MIRGPIIDDHGSSQAILGNRQVIGQAKIVKPVEGWNNDRDQIFCHDPFNHGLRDLFGYPDVTNNPTNLVNLTSSKVCVIRKVDSEIMNSISNNPSEFLFAPSPKRMAPQIPAKKGTGFYSVPRHRYPGSKSPATPRGNDRNYLVWPRLFRGGALNARVVPDSRLWLRSIFGVSKRAIRLTHPYAR